MRRAVGKNVRRKDSDAKVTGAAKYIDDLSFPGMLHGATVRSTIPRGRLDAHSPRLRHRRLHRRRLPRRPRPQHRRADRRRPAVPGRARGLSLRRADPAARARGSRAAAGARVCTIDYTPQPALFDPERSNRDRSRSIAIDKGSIAEGFAAGRRRRRGRVPHRASGAALHRDQRRHCRARGRWHDASTARCSARTTCTAR